MANIRSNREIKEQLPLLRKEHKRTGSIISGKTEERTSSKS
jgi:hypothetical protein